MKSISLILFVVLTTFQVQAQYATKDPANGKYGFSDKTGKMIIPGKYDAALDFKDSMAAVNIGGDFDQMHPFYGGKSGFIDMKGKEVIPPQFKNVMNFNGGYAAVANDINDETLWGFIDKKGKQVIPFKYYVHPRTPGFQNGVVPIQLKDKEGDLQFGIINLKNQAIVPFGKYDEMDKTGFHNGLIGVMKGDTLGFVNAAGKEAISLKYYFNPEWVWGRGLPAFSEGMAKVDNKDGQIGYINLKGVEVIPFGKYQFGEPFSEGLALVRKDKSNFFIDKTGKEVISLAPYVKAWSFEGGIAMVTKKNEEVKGGVAYGFIDKTGKEVIPAKFEKISSFSEGLAAVKLNGEWGYIDKNGTLVIPAIYADCEPFKYGKASVYNTEGKEMIIDKTGKKL